MALLPLWLRELLKYFLGVFLICSVSIAVNYRYRWETERKQLEKESAIEGCIPVSDTIDKYHEKSKGNVKEYEGKDEKEPEEELPDTALFKQRRLFEEYQNKDRKDGSLSAGNLDGRLDRALEFASRNQRPEERAPIDIQNAIVNSLKKCPNYSCTLKSLTSRVLKELGVLTRGNPRLEFEKRVIRNLGVLKRKGLVEEYKAKNKRIRLLT